VEQITKVEQIAKGGNQLHGQMEKYTLNVYRLNFGSFVMFPPAIFGIGTGLRIAVGICDPPKKNSGVLLDICLRAVDIGVKRTGLYPEFIVCTMPIK
jgi:hypothetical protein